LRELEERSHAMDRLLLPPTAAPGEKKAGRRAYQNSGVVFGPKEKKKKKKKNCKKRRGRKSAIPTQINFTSPYIERRIKKKKKRDTITFRSPSSEGKKKERGGAREKSLTVGIS